AKIKLGEIGRGDEGSLYLKASVETRSLLLSLTNLANSSSVELLKLIQLGVPLIMNPAKQEFLKRVQEAAAQPPSFKVATKTGLFGNVFVHPYFHVPQDAPKVERCFPEKFAQYHEHFRSRGTLEGWKEM